MTKMGGEQVEVWIEKMILLEMVSEISSQIDENSFDLTFIEKKYVIILLTSRIKTKFGWGDILNTQNCVWNCVKYFKSTFIKYWKVNRRIIRKSFWYLL